MCESWHKYIISQAPIRSGKDTREGRQQKLNMLGLSVQQRVRICYYYICNS